MQQEKRVQRSPEQPARSLSVPPLLTVSRKFCPSLRRAQPGGLLGGQDAGCTKAALHVFFPNFWLTRSGRSLSGDVDGASDTSTRGMSKTRGDRLFFHGPWSAFQPCSYGSSLHAKTSILGTLQQLIPTPHSRSAPERESLAHCEY